MIKIPQADIQEIKDNFQELVDKGIASVITVVWRGNFHDVFVPKKHDNGQLVLDGMEMPDVKKICQKVNEGE